MTHINSRPLGELERAAMDVLRARAPLTVGFARGRFACAAAMLALALAPWPAWAATPVDEATAVARFLATSPEVHAAASAVETDRAELVTAGTWANPTVALDREQVFTAAGPTEQHRLGFQAILPVTGIRPVRLEAAEAGVVVAEARARQATFLLALSFRAAFNEAAGAEARVQDLNAHARTLQRLARIVEVRRLAGESAGANVLRARLATADVAAWIADGVAEAEATRSRVAGTLGRPLDGPYQVAPIPAPPPADVLIARAFRSRADITGLKAELSAARLAETLAERRRWPEPQPPPA